MVSKKTQAIHWAGKSIDIVESYWISPPATERSKWFVEQLRSFEFNSIFEVGYFSGRNLKYIEESFPKVMISGIEVNKKAVNFAREKLPNLKLMELDLFDLDKVSKKYDLVFTSGVIIHIPPENTREAIQKIIRRSNKYVMHIEGIGNNELVAGPKELKPTRKQSDQWQWAPSIPEIYKSLGYEPAIVELPKECKTNGASELVIVEVK